MLRPEDLFIKIDNGRLQLPRSELILLYGAFKDGTWDANLYSTNVNLSETLRLISENKEAGAIEGSLGTIDIFIKGALWSPKISGTCDVIRFAQSDFLLSDCSLRFDVQIRSGKKGPRFYGQVSAQKGKIAGPKTALIDLRESRVSFAGDPQKAALDIKGKALVDWTKINIELKGTMEQPDLKLTSDPPLPQALWHLQFTNPPPV